MCVFVCVRARVRASVYVLVSYIVRKVCKDRRTDGQAGSAQTHAWTENRQTDGRTLTDRHISMDRQTQTYGQTDTGLWTDRHIPMDRQTQNYGQTDRHTHMNRQT